MPVFVNYHSIDAAVSTLHCFTNTILVVLHKAPALSQGVHRGSAFGWQILKEVCPQNEMKTYTEFCTSLAGTWHGHEKKNQDVLPVNDQTQKGHCQGAKQLWSSFLFSRSDTLLTVMALCVSLRVLPTFKTFSVSDSS